MGSIKNEKIGGYILDQDIVCVKCVTQEELKELMDNQIITDDEVQNSDEIFSAIGAKMKSNGGGVMRKGVTK